MIVARVPDIKADLRKNWKPILFVFGALILYIFISGVFYSFAEGLTYLRSVYFTIINVTTVGFGDIYPLTHFGKIIAICNSFAGLLIFGVLVATITMALQPKEFSGEVTQKNPELDVAEIADRKLTPEDEFIDGLSKFLRGMGSLSSRPSENRREEDDPELRTVRPRVYIEVAVRDKGLRWINIYVGVHRDI